MDSEGTGTNRIQVLVRVRPPIGQEATEELAVACSPTQEHVQVLLPERSGDKPQLPSHASLKGTARKYTLDACLDGSVSQENVAMVCNVDDLVDGALQGFAVTIFAFGQTGSGKTYSVIGPRLGSGAFDKQQLITEADGFLPRAYAAVFNAINAQQSELHVQVRASCCEIYHEQVSDLAAGSKQSPLAVRHDKHKGFFVEGLTEVPCASCTDALSFMHKALTLRHIRSTRLNEYSSRGHCIMTLQFETTPELSRVDSSSRPDTANPGLPVKKYGKLVLVDLAGSERLKSTGNEGEVALRETGSINRSLFTLGQVLAGLSMRSKPSLSSVPPVIPYRDSTLTKLLYEGLKGNGRVLMMACCSPTKAQAEETLNTLHFASMALRVKCNPLCILDPQDKLVLNLRGTISKLRTENKQLSTALQRSRSQSGDGSSNRDPEFESETNIWEARQGGLPHMRTLDNQALSSYPSLCKPTPQGLNHYPSLSSQSIQGIWGSLPRPRASASLQGLDAEGSSEFMPGSLSSVAEDDVWAASHMGTMRSTQSLGGSVPIGSSPERVRLIQEDYHATGSSSKNSSPKRGRLSPPRGDVSPKRDVSPKHSKAGTVKGPFVLSANPSAFSLSTLPSTLQAGGGARGVPLPGVEDFPELAAMEAEFQKSLARGPMKPSQLADQSVLQTSSSLGFPKGILQRHALSLGSSKGFGRNSPAAGILGSLQMPNRPGLKFPSRDFGRISSKTLSSMPLSPKPSLPRSRADSPRAASPEAPAAEAEAEAVEPPLPTAEEEIVAVEEAEEEAPESHPLPSEPAAAEEAVRQPEPRRLPHSRFTEEYLRPIVPDRHSQPVQAQSTREVQQSPRAVLVLAETGTQSSEPQYSDEATETAQAPEPVTIETQTSVLAVAEPIEEPMHGFRRHMSLREPDTLLHPRLGRPTADDIITTAQPHMAAPQRRATTDFMLDDAVEQDSEAVAAEAASQPAAEDGQYDSDLVTDLVKSLSSAAADYDEEDQDAAVAEIAAGLQSGAADDYSMDADMAVDSTLERVATDADSHFSARATAVVDDTIATLRQDADAQADLEQSQAVELTLVSVTSAAATADAADQAEAVDAAVSHLAAHVTNDYTADQQVTADAVVTSLTSETEAADDADQLAAVATAVDSLRAQSAEHYEHSDSLAVAEALGGLQTDATEHYSSQAAASADQAVRDLANEALRASDAEQAATAGAVIDSLASQTVDADRQTQAMQIDQLMDQLGTDTAQQADMEAATAVDSAMDGVAAEAISHHAREVTTAVDDTVMRLESDTVAQYDRDAGSAVDGMIDDLGTDAAAQYARDESSAIDSVLNDVKASAESADESDAELAVATVMEALGDDTVQFDSAEADGTVADIMTGLESDTAAAYSQREDADVSLVLAGLTQTTEQAADQEAAAAIDGLVTDLGSDTATYYRRQDSALVNATLDALTTDAVHHFTADQTAALDASLASLSASAEQHYNEQQDSAVRALVTDLGAEAADYYAADQAAAIGSALDGLASQAEADQEEEARSVAAATVSGLAVEAALAYDQQESTAVAAVVTTLGADTAQMTDANDMAAIQEVVAALGDSAAAFESAEQAHAVHAVLASLANEAGEHFSTEQEAALQSTLQSLTKAAFDEEEADRDAAVHEVVTALSGDAEGAAANSLKGEVEGLVNELRVEVAEAAAQEYDAQQAEQQAAQEARQARYNRQQSLVVDRMVDTLTLEAAASYGGTRKPAAAQALKRHLHKAAERLPSLASPASLVPLDTQSEVTAQLAQDSAPPPQDSASVSQDSAAGRLVMPVTVARDYARENAAALEAAYEIIRQTEGIRSEKDGAAILEAAYAIIREAEGIHFEAATTPSGLVTAEHAQHAWAVQLQPGSGAVTAVPRLHSIDSINALVWPLSRRVSSADSRSSDHLHLYVDHGGDHLQLFVDQSQLQPVTFPRLRSTASINALVWPASRRVSSASDGSHTTAVTEVTEVVDGAATAVAETTFRPLPSAASIDSLLWPGDIPSAYSAVHAEHAELQIQPSVSSPAPFRLPLSPPSSRVAPSSARAAQKQQSLLDRAAAKRALASLLAAAKASQIRGWSPRQQGTSPVPSESAAQEVASAAVPVALPSLADIEALCVEEDSRVKAVEAAEPAAAAPPQAAPTAPDVPSQTARALAEEQEKDSLQVLEEAIQAAALEADFTFPDDSSSSQGDQSLVIDDIIESLESDALEAEQEALAVRQAEEEAQAILQAEQAAFAAQRAEEEAQAAVRAEQQARAARQAEEAARAALRAEIRAEEEARAAAHVMALQAVATAKAEEEARVAAARAEEEARVTAALMAEEEARLAAAQRAEEEAQAARTADEQARAARQAEAEAQAARQAEEEARLARQAEEEARLARQAEEEAEAAAVKANQEATAAAHRVVEQAMAAAKAEEEARVAVARAEEEARGAAAAKAEEEARVAAAKAEEEARLAAARAEAEARAAALAEEEARVAAAKAEEEAKVAAAKAEEEARAAAEMAAYTATLRAKEEARAAAQKAVAQAQAAAEMHAWAAAIKTQEKARAAAIKAEEEARAAALKAEEEAKAAALQAQEEARAAALKAQAEARAARQAQEEAKAFAALGLADGHAASRHVDDVAALIDQQQALAAGSAKPVTGSNAASPRKEADIMSQKKVPIGKEGLAEDYPGLEQPIVPAEALFKFKGQSMLYEDSPPGSIRSAPGAAAMTEIGVYNMSQEALPTFREGPLNAAVSIAPRSRLGRNQSSMAPGDADRMLRGESSYDELSRSQSQASFAFADGRPYSSIDRTRSALAYSDPATQRLMERSGSSMSQYDAQGNVIADAPEPQALQWAARNPWFGTDSEMTYFAYEVHDHLIEVEGMDPNSKEYYEQIGLRVAAEFPDRYAERSLQPTPRLSDMPPTVTTSLRQMSRSGRMTPIDPPTLPTVVEEPTASQAASQAASVKTAVVTKRTVTSASSTASGSSYTSGSYTTASGSRSRSGSGTSSSYGTGSSYTTATGSSSGSQSRSVSDDGSRSTYTGSSSFSGSRSTYTRSGSGSDSRTTSASSYTTATDSRPASARLPAIAAAQPKGKGLPPVAVKKATAVVKSKVAVKKSEQRRPDTASSYSSESGSDSSYSSSSSSGGSDSSYSRSDSYTSHSSPRPSEQTKLPKLSPTRQKADANSRGKPAAAAAPAGKKVVVASTVTKSSRVVSRAASDSGSSASSYTSSSTSRTNTARSSKLPAIAAAKGSSSSGKVSQSVNKSGKTPQSMSVQQQREVVRSNLQQTKAATNQEQARIKNTIQRQLQPGKMLV